MGGSAGIRALKKLLKRWDRLVVFARAVGACCAEKVMRRALPAYRGPVLGTLAARLVVRAPLLSYPMGLFR